MDRSRGQCLLGMLASFPSHFVVITGSLVGYNFRSPALSGYQGTVVSRAGKTSVNAA